MSQNVDKSAMIAEIEKINKVDGFDPMPFGVDYTDLNTGATRKRLPVVIQIAWFRMRYPNGKIAVSVSAAKECFVATAKVYPNYTDNPECYLAEGTASRRYIQDKPSISPREWAQTAAIGIALRNAGFGLQFAMAGDEFESYPENDEFLEACTKEQQASNEYTEKPEDQSEQQDAEYVQEVPEAKAEPKELSAEEKIEAAKQIMCPISKYSGKTLGDLISIDPRALTWLATKYTNDDKIKNAAEIICEYALATTA